MKILVTLFCLASLKTVQGFSEEVMEMAKMLHETCVAETEVDEALIDLAAKGEFTPEPRLKCYLKCVMQTMGAMEDDGTVEIETMISIIPEEVQDLIAPSIRICGTQRGSDPCDTAFLTNQCYYKNNPEHYILF